jgi:flagellar basal-body rod modification protein FlgD
VSTPAIGGLTDPTILPTTPTTTSANGSSSSADPTNNSTSQLGENDFLNLLVTQLQNQDPLQPQDDSAFVAELAQFSALQEMTGARQDLDTLVGDAQSLTSAIGSATGASSTSPSSTTPAPTTSNLTTSSTDLD